MASSAGVRPPTLNLTPPKPGLDVPGHGRRQLVPREVVVAADDADRQRIGDAPPGPVERQPERPPEHVPDRDVDRGDRLEREAAVAQDVVGRGLHRPPGALRVGRAPADDARRELVVDDPDDERLLRVGVAGVDLRGQPVRRRQPGHDRAPVVHAVGAALVTAPERRAERQRLDSLDDQRARSEAGRRSPGHRPVVARAASAIAAADGTMRSSSGGVYGIG